MRRRHRAKLGVMPDRSRYQPLTQHANRAKVSKSRMAFLAKEGYQKMAHEDGADAEAYLLAMSEILED